MRVRRCLPLFTVLILACLVVSAKEANWTKLRSEHFEIYSAENEKKARKVLEHLERTRKAFEFLTKVEITRKQPIRVVLFRNEAEYREYAYGPFSAAYYLNALDRDYIVLSDFDSRTERVLNHEFFHLFSRHAEFELPVWLEEGLADFYSTMRITDKDISIGLPVEAHLKFLNFFTGSIIPMARIFAVSRETRHQGGKEANSLLYAQGWALAHMTFLSKEMMTRSNEFFEKVRTKGSAADAFEQVYGLKPENIDQLLRAYIQQRSYQYLKLAVNSLNFEAPTEPAAMEDWEVPLTLADLLMFTGKKDAAAARYAELSTQYPDRPEFAESLGYLAFRNGQREEAVQRFREAAEKQSSSSRLYVDLCMLGCDVRAMDTDCRNWIDRALHLDPANKNARKWAVANALNGREWTRALVLLSRTGKINEEEAPELFHQIAYANYHLNHFDDAEKAIVRGLQHASTPAEREPLMRMRSAVEQARIYRSQAQQPGVGTRIEAGAPPAGPEAPRTQPEQDGTRPQLVRRESGTVTRGVDEAGQGGREADAVIEQFILSDGAMMTSAVLESMDCGGDAPVVVVKARGRTLKLAIRDPQAVRVIRDSEIVTDHEFTCGSQKAETVLVGYRTEDAAEGSDGVLYILSFQ